MSGSEQRLFKFLVWFLIVPALLIGYTNCGNLMTNATSASEVDSFGGGSCDEVVLKQYQATFYPFFLQATTCLGCHIEGGQGLGVFASTDVASSFASFNAAGVTKIQYMAENSAHKPPFTGAQNKPAVDPLVTKWVDYQNDYLSCVTKTQNGGVDESLLTSSKPAPLIYSGGDTSQTLSWDLDLAGDLDTTATRALPARITIDVKVLYQVVNGVSRAQGYIFTNPTMAMKDDKQQVVIEGLFFQINNVPITSQTTFTGLSRVVKGTTAIPLMKASANTLIQPVSSNDKFQLYIRRIVPTSMNDLGSPPLTPVLNLADTVTSSSTFLKNKTANAFIVRDAGITRWCLSESPIKPASTEAVCQNSMMGTVNGWSLTRPTQFTFSAGDGVKNLYLWVANENLLINDTAASAQITLDTAAPVAPVINSVQISDTQVAALSVSHANESDVTGWCVLEQNSIRATPTEPKLDDACWRWTDNGAKPTTVGFKDGGSRDVFVYVRDQAGNVSPASNKKTVTNTFGAITFTQLGGLVGNPRSIFSNRCLTCHGSSTAPGFSKLQLNDYTSTVTAAKSGVLVLRINSVLSPMPNVNDGVMPQRERDLIRLWTLPEEGTTPLP